MLYSADIIIKMHKALQADKVNQRKGTIVLLITYQEERRLSKLNGKRMKVQSHSSFIGRLLCKF